MGTVVDHRRGRGVTVGIGEKEQVLGKGNGSNVASSEEAGATQWHWVDAARACKAGVRCGGSCRATVATS